MKLRWEFLTEPCSENCTYGMLCFRMKIFFTLMSPFVNELIDIITDIFYLNKVSYPKYESHLETEHFIYSLLGKFTYHLFHFLKFKQ